MKHCIPMILLAMLIAPAYAQDSAAERYSRFLDRMDRGIMADEAIRQGIRERERRREERIREDYRADRGYRWDDRDRRRRRDEDDD